MEYERYDEGLIYRYVYGVDKLGVTAYTIPNGSASVTTDAGEIPLYYHMDHMGSSEFLTSDVTQIKYGDEAALIIKKADGTIEKVIRNISKNSSKNFNNVNSLNQHYSKHGKEIAGILEKSNYSVKDYLDDANYIIQNGDYSPELNGYVKFLRGDNYGFVGLDRETGNITTFHIKKVGELAKKAPSLGLYK